MIPEVSNKQHFKLDRILRNFCFDHNLWFSVVFEYYASMCSVPLLIHKWRFHSFLTLLYGYTVYNEQGQVLTNIKRCLLRNFWDTQTKKVSSKIHVLYTPALGIYFFNTRNFLKHQRGHLAIFFVTRKVFDFFFCDTLLSGLPKISRLTNSKNQNFGEHLKLSRDKKFCRKSFSVDVKLVTRLQPGYLPQSNSLKCVLGKITLLSRLLLFPNFKKFRIFVITLNFCREKHL